MFLKCFPIGSSASVAFGVTFTSLSLTAQLSRQAKAFLATLASVTRARAPCPIRFWMSLDPAPTLLCATKGRTVGSVCDSHAKYFLKLSTHTIVYSRRGVHNWDIPASVDDFPQRDVASFQRNVAAGVMFIAQCRPCAPSAQNKNPGIAAGVLHSWSEIPALRCTASRCTASGTTSSLRSPCRPCRRRGACRRRRPGSSSAVRRSWLRW